MVVFRFLTCSVNRIMFMLGRFLKNIWANMTHLCPPTWIALLLVNLCATLNSLGISWHKLEKISYLSDAYTPEASFSQRQEWSTHNDGAICLKPRLLAREVKCLVITIVRESSHTTNESTHICPKPIWK